MSDIRRIGVHLFCLAIVVSCGDDKQMKDEKDSGIQVVQTMGGTVDLPGCDAMLTSRFGATVPMPSVDNLGDAPTPKHIHLGFSSDPSTNVALVWRTEDDDSFSSIARFGVETLDNEQVGFLTSYRSGISSLDPFIRIHEVHLCNLTPDTEYQYQVGGRDSDGTSSFSETFTFRTAPARDSNADDEIVVAVLGDSRDGYDIWSSLMTLAATYAPDLVVLTGDAVTLGSLQEEWELLFDSLGQIGTRVPMVSAHGNHEVHAPHFYTQFAMPGNEENFSFDFGPLHFAVANDTPEDGGDIAGTTANFLDTDFGASTNSWNILTHHRPMWSASSRHGSDEELRQAWQPIIDEHHVDLVIAGHEHHYERTKPLFGDSVVASSTEGTVYLVSGGAGATLYENGSDFWTEFSSKTHGLMIMRATKNRLDIESLTETGALIDSFSMIKPAPFR